MKDKAYPFLITTNAKGIGYMSVALPEFLKQDCLAFACGGDEITDKNTAFIRQIVNTDSNDSSSVVTCIFRVCVPLKKDIGINEEGELPVGGRRAYLVDGLAFKGKIAEKFLHKEILVTEKDLEKAHQQTIHYYKDFLDSNSWNSCPTKSFILDNSSNDPALKLIFRKQDYDAKNLIIKDEPSDVLPKPKLDEPKPEPQPMPKAVIKQEPFPSFSIQEFEELKNEVKKLQKSFENQLEELLKRIDEKLRNENQDIQSITQHPKIVLTVSVTAIVLAVVAILIVIIK